jgi:hypothetical protein
MSLAAAGDEATMDPTDVFLNYTPPAWAVVLVVVAVVLFALWVRRNRQE